MMGELVLKKMALAELSESFSKVLRRASPACLRACSASSTASRGGTAARAHLPGAVTLMTLESPLSVPLRPWLCTACEMRSPAERGTSCASGTAQRTTGTHVQCLSAGEAGPAPARGEGPGVQQQDEPHARHPGRRPTPRHSKRSRTLKHNSRRQAAATRPEQTPRPRVLGSHAGLTVRRTPPGASACRPKWAWLLAGTSRTGSSGTAELVHASAVLPWCGAGRSRQRGCRICTRRQRQRRHFQQAAIAS